MKETTRFSQGKRVLVFTLIINTTLAISKILIGYLAHSRAIIADGIHSASDSFSTIIVFFSLRYACTPPDSSHPYGHERSETLASNILALSLIVSGLFILKDNLTSIINRDLFYPQFINIWAALVSIIAQEGTYHYAMHVGKKINSPSIMADAIHHRSDALSSIAALFGVIAARNGLPILDPIAGIVVGGMIIRVGWGILIDTINELMEASPDEKYLNQITGIAVSIEKVKTVTDLKIRKHAASEIIEMTITVNSKLSMEKAHQIAHQVKNEIIDKVSQHQIKEVYIHVDPYYLKNTEQKRDNCVT